MVGNETEVHYTITNREETEEKEYNAKLKCIRKIHESPTFPFKLQIISRVVGTALRIGDHSLNMIQAHHRVSSSTSK
jgi:hypothetical protein